MFPQHCWLVTCPGFLNAPQGQRLRPAPAPDQGRRPAGAPYQPLPDLDRRQPGLSGRGRRRPDSARELLAGPAARRTGSDLHHPRRQAEGRAGLHGRLTRHQARIFFPLLTLEGLSLRISSVTYLLARRPRRGAVLELALIAAHLSLYVGGLLLVMSPQKALVFVVLHQALFGLHLGSVFAPNHKGMEMPGDCRGGLRTQCRMTQSPRPLMPAGWSGRRRAF